MAFQLDSAAFKSAPTVSDYMMQNQKAEQERRANEQAMSMNAEKIRQEKVRQAVIMATPETYSAIRAKGIQEGLWDAASVPEQWDDNMMRQLKQSVGGVKSDMGFKVVGNQIVQLNDQTGEVRPVYTAPSTAPINPETGQPERKLTSTEQKELFDTTDLINASKNVNTTLSQALGILKDSPKGAEPYTGFMAGTRAAASRLPVVGDIIADKERGSATTEYSTLITEQALNNLKTIFGGMPTEGERQILLQMQALPEYTPQEQEKIIKNAQAAADRRMQSAEQKAKAITTGNYSGMVSEAARPNLNTKVGTQSTGIKFLGFE